VRFFLRIFFHFLYHQFAFAYDFIAAFVSFGHWKDWIMEVIPFIEGTRTLEIGHGPGHLQRVLLDRSLVTVAIDESAPMGRLARHNLSKSDPAPSSPTSDDDMYQSGYAQINLTRGLAQHLPFRAESFDTVIATFPAEYIFDPSTLTEANRVLRGKGRFVILAGALITGRKIWERFMAWVYRITGQTPPNLSEILHERSREPFAKAGFRVEVKELEVKSGIAFIVVATKSTIAQ
jgi:ubiquinone/menaquinone biosynthesis C-methylase UbiE